MKSKLIIFSIALISVLICISPIIASDNSYSTFSVVDDLLGNKQLNVSNLIIEKELYQHTDANGKVDKHNNYYIDFKINTESDSKYMATITSYDNKNKQLESFNHSISSTGDQKVKLKDSKKVKNVKSINVVIKDSNGNVVFNNTTSAMKKTKDITKDKPVNQKTSSSSSGATYWGSSNSGKFHNPSCEWAQKISSKNKVVFHSRDEAISSGYQPCSVCSP